MPVLSTSHQMTLNFEPGLSDQHESLKEFMRDEALPELWRTQKIPKKYVAADMELRPSELTRKLSDNPNDKRNFTTDDLEKYLERFNDLSPIFYLLDKYAKDTDDEIARLEAKLAQLKGQG